MNFKTVRSLFPVIPIFCAILTFLLRVSVLNSKRCLVIYDPTFILQQSKHYGKFCNERDLSTGSPEQRLPFGVDRCLEDSHSGILMRDML